MVRTCSWSGVFIDPVGGLPTAPPVKLLASTNGVGTQAAWHDGKSYQLLILELNSPSGFTGYKFSFRRFDSALVGLDPTIPEQGTLIASDIDQYQTRFAFASNGQGRTLFLSQQVDDQRLGVALKGRFIDNDGLPAPSPPDAGAEAGDAGLDMDSATGPDADAMVETPDADAAIEAPDADAAIETPDADAMVESPDADAATEAPDADAATETPDADAALQGPDADAASKPDADAASKPDAVADGPQSEAHADAAADAAPVGPSEASDDEGGCGCRTAGSESGAGGSVLVGIAWLLRARAIRRRKRVQAESPLL